MSKVTLPVLMILLAAHVHAQVGTPATTAMLVEEPDENRLDVALGEALVSTDPAVRAVAARVAAVRNRTELLPRIEPLLATEPNPEAARELIRAAILLGGASEIDRAIATSVRFQHRLDTSVAVATARLGNAAAMDAYETKLEPAGITPEYNFYLISLWSTPEAVPPTAARLLARHDEKGWRGFIDAVMTSAVTLDAGNLAVALSSPSETIRVTTTDAILNHYSKKTLFSDDVKRVLRETPVGADDPPYVAFKRELLRRIGGAEQQHSEKWRSWIHEDDVTDYFRRRPPLMDLLSPDEAAAMAPVRRKYTLPTEHAYPTVESNDGASRPSIREIEVLPPQFYLPEVLPDGAADAILSSTGCRAEWVGLGDMSVDRAGRVKSLDVSRVDTNDNCKKAIDAITRLGFVHPTSITSRFDTKYALFVKPARSSLCIDEGPVPAAAEVNYEACNPFHVGGDSPCTPPVVTKRIQPKFPEGKTIPGGGNAIVIVESTVTETGCVRAARLVVQSPFAELNRSALLSILGWKFRPATIAGVPVPVTFNLTINFKGF